MGAHCCQTRLLHVNKARVRPSGPPAQLLSTSSLSFARRVTCRALSRLPPVWLLLRPASEARLLRPPLRRQLACPSGVKPASPGSPWWRRYPRMGDTASQPRAGIEERAVPGKCSLRSCPAPALCRGLGRELSTAPGLADRPECQDSARHAGGSAPSLPKTSPSQEASCFRSSSSGGCRRPCARASYPTEALHTCQARAPHTLGLLFGAGVSLVLGPSWPLPTQPSISGHSPDPATSQLRSLDGSPLPVKLSTDSSPGRARP